METRDIPLHEKLKALRPVPKKKLNDRQALAVLDGAFGDAPKLSVAFSQRTEGRFEFDLENDKGGRYAVSAREVGPAAVVVDRVVTPSGSVWEGSALKLEPQVSRGIRSIYLASQAPEVTVECVYRVYVNGRRAGMHFQNGRGKKGLSFPAFMSLNIFASKEDAEEAARKLRLYLEDLAAAPKKKTKTKKKR